MTKSLHPYRAVRAEGGELHDRREQLAVERPLRILINKEVFTILMQLPGDEIDLTTGLLCTEGMITPDLPYGMTLVEGKGMDDVEVTISGLDMDGVINKRSLLSATSCGICGTRELNIPVGAPIDSGNIRTDHIPTMFRDLRDHQPAFQASGGTHAVGLYDASGKQLIIKEDVGRHNAADKAIGALYREARLDQASFMILSGRVSYEMIVKAFKARIPVIAAVSAPTSMAIDFCLEWGIALFGFCREERFTRYA